MNNKGSKKTVNDIGIEPG
jgi:magnesium-transporting ATPase (P-type)